MKQAISHAEDPATAAPFIKRLKDVLAKPGVKEGWEQFLEDSHTFSKRYANLLEAYPDEFIVFYKGEVQARGRSRDEAVLKADKKGLPRNGPITRFMDTNPPPLFLPTLFL